MNGGRLAVQRKEAAELLSIGVDTFDRYVRPSVPVVYVGSARLYPVSGLLAFLDSEAVRSYDGTGSTKRPRAVVAAGGMAQEVPAP